MAKKLAPPPGKPNHHKPRRPIPNPECPQDLSINAGAYDGESHKPRMTGDGAGSIVRTPKPTRGLGKRPWRGEGSTNELKSIPYRWNDGGISRDHPVHKPTRKPVPSRKRKG